MMKRSGSQYTSSSAEQRRCQTALSGQGLHFPATRAEGWGLWNASGSDVVPPQGGSGYPCSSIPTLASLEDSKAQDRGQQTFSVKIAHVFGCRNHTISVTATVGKPPEDDVNEWL